MPTDEERRRVARKLREYASWDGEEDCFVDCADWGERVLNLLYRDGEDRTEGEYYARLADLIDPDTTTDTTNPGADTTKCDRDALLELADEMDGDTLAVPLVYGSYQSGYIAAMRDCARRIREACGGTAG